MTVIESASVCPIVVKSPTVVKPPAITAVMVKTRVVKTSAVEISPMVSFEKRTVVLEVYAVPVVTVPRWVVVVDVSGVIGFTNLRIGIIAAVIFRRGLFVDGCGLFIHGLLIDYRRCYGRGADVYPSTGYAKTDVCIYIYLGVAFRSDETCGCNGGEDG
jgi:hypothetical protein